MSQWPYIDYIKNGEQVTLKLPDTVDLWEFLAYLDTKFMGIDPAVIVQRRADEVIESKRLVKRGRK